MGPGPLSRPLTYSGFIPRRRRARRPDLEPRCHRPAFPPCPPRPGPLIPAPGLRQGGAKAKAKGKEVKKE